jgi:hypothetical protein
MRKSRFSEDQIIAILKPSDIGKTLKIGRASVYRVLGTGAG